MSKKKPTITSSKPQLTTGKPTLQTSAVNPRLLLAQEPIDDPLAEVEYGNGIEADSAAEASALLQGFRERAKQEAERFTLATDSEFWVAIGFQSREQKDVFLQVMEWFQLGDKYLDGTQIAALMGIELPKVELANKKVKADKKLKPLVKRP